MANKRGWWQLFSENVENDALLELSDVDREHIAELIKQGYTEGEIVPDA